jgi:hypothetical protein
MSRVRSIKGKTDEKTERDLAVVERFCLVSDDSSHRYAIPVYLRDDFYKWAADEDTEDPNKYDEYRVDGLLTFTDPRTS